MSERMARIGALLLEVDRDRSKNVFLCDEMNASLLSEAIDLMRPLIPLAEIAQSICDGEDQGYPPDTSRLRDALKELGR